MRRRLVRRLALRVLTLVLLLLLVLLLRDDVGSVLEVVHIVGEEIVLLSINNRLNDLSGFLSFVLEDGSDDFHNIGNEGGEASENSFNNALGHVFKHAIHILEEIKSRLS